MKTEASGSQESKLGNRFTFGYKSLAASSQANPREFYSVKPTPVGLKGVPAGLATQPSPKKSRNAFGCKTQ